MVIRLNYLRSITHKLNQPYQLNKLLIQHPAFRLGISEFGFRTEKRKSMIIRLNYLRSITHKLNQPYQLNKLLIQYREPRTQTSSRLRSLCL
jgi:hypothetical protein